MAKTYRAAIVGCGRIASGFANDKRRKGIVTHAQAYQAHPRTKLVAACDVDAGKLREFGARWKVRSLYNDVGRMLKKEMPDLLSICTWNTTHESLVKAAVKAGVKGILCEKPLSDSMASARRMVAVCRKAGVPLLVNYSRRYNRMHRDIKDLIDRGGLGEIQCVSAYYMAGIANTGTHLFDLLLYFFGPVAWAQAHPDKVLKGKDPTVDGYLFFKRGFGASLSALDVSSYMQFEVDIYGTKGRLRLCDTGLEARFWKVEPHRTFSEYRTLTEGRRIRTDFGKNLYWAVDDLVRSVEKRTTPLCDGHQAEGSLEVALALLSSLKKGARVRLPLRDAKLRLESK